MNEPIRKRPPVLVAYGGGVNSTALLCGLAERGERPDAVLFADTGAERPETYDYVSRVGAWLLARGFPPLTVVRDELGGPLEERCLSQGMLPSLAYGRHRRGCSEKSKQRPQHRWARAWPLTAEWWAAEEGNRVVKLIGYGADERYRARITEDRWYEYDYPLMAWGWDRAACVTAIARGGLPPAPRSACFFCPASKKPEILELKRRHPDLLARALELESRGSKTLHGKGIKGLGGYFAWQKFLADHESPMPLFEPRDPAEIDDNPFGCLCVTPTPDEDELEYPA